MIDETNEFQYFHSYRRLASDGVVEPLKCTCGAEYVTLVEDSRLVLWCPVDDYTVTPGHRTLLLVEKAVNSYT